MSEVSDVKERFGLRLDELEVLLLELLFLRLDNDDAPLRNKRYDALSL